MHNALVNLGIAVAISVGAFVVLTVWSAFVVASRADAIDERNRARRRALLMANKQ